jgi:hypothetical protein
MRSEAYTDGGTPALVVATAMHGIKATNTTMHPSPTLVIVSDVHI